MKIIGFSEARATLSAVFDAVVAGHNPVVVVRRGAEAVVLVSLADWRAREESEYLCSNRVNAERLGQAIRELDAGGALWRGRYGTFAGARPPSPPWQASRPSSSNRRHCLTGHARLPDRRSSRALRSLREALAEPPLTRLQAAGKAVGERSMRCLARADDEPVRMYKIYGKS